MSRLETFSKLLPVTLLQQPKWPVYRVKIPIPCSLRSWSFLALAKPQCWYSSLNCLKTSLTDRVIPSNMQSLWCFWIRRAVKMINEFVAPFPHSLTLQIVLTHQFANQRSMANHTCLEKTNLVRRCWIVSSSWSHKGHFSGWHFSTRKTISCPTTVLNRELDEKFTFTRCPTLPIHSRLQCWKAIDLLKNTRYANFAEYEPEVLKHQMC
jgi:hypothetical protein